jgi:hypothetical protein
MHTVQYVLGFLQREVIGTIVTILTSGTEMNFPFGIILLQYCLTAVPVRVFAKKFAEKV